jgi:predicted nucleic acid-binding protein
MPRIVSNTTPIIWLLKLNRLELLQKLYQQVFIPNAVFREIEAGKSKDFYQDFSRIERIKIVEIENKNAVKYFLDLDEGEAEAIVLDTELEADSIILDEMLGRFHAKHANLKGTGTLGILIKAKSEQLIDSLKPLLDELAEKDVWIS